MTATAQPVSISKRGGVAREVSHNLNGQRLGRKGRDTRDRILAVARDIIAESEETQITLSEVARRAELRMASLYTYFADLSELIEALLEPVMAEAELAYLSHVRQRWPDEELGDRSAAFIAGFYSFWHRNARILHLRNTMADQKDAGMIRHRIDAARPVIGHIVKQMGRDPDERGTSAVGMATVLYMGFERAINIATDSHFGEGMGEAFAPDIEHYLEAEAQLLEYGIRKFRSEV